MARGEMVRLGRRGMSPLIATVLLMAFAVALGGMIMNWSIDITINADCEMMNEIVVSQFCTQDNNIILRAKSDAESIPLQSVRLKIVSGNIEHELNVKNSELEPGDSLALSIPFGTTSDASVELIGVIGTNQDPFICSENPIERVSPILPCS